MKIICIVGPTGVGKTKLSIELAKIYDGEIINGDSTQVYKNLNIATAKVTEHEMQGIKHHLIDIKDVKDDYTVFDFQKDGRACILEIEAQGKVPIVVGGTGLYLKALFYDYQFSESVKKNNYQNYSLDDLYKEVLKIDKNTQIHRNNRKRLERFLDYYKSIGKIISDNKTDKLLYDVVFIGLTTTRNHLYDLINKRVDKMVENGLIQEAKQIYKSNIRTKAILTPIGYKELFPYFEGKSKLEECLEEIKKNSRHYAKRQYTWFNNQMNVHWFNVDFDNFDNTVKEIKNFIDNL